MVGTIGFQLAKNRKILDLVIIQKLHALVLNILEMVFYEALQELPQKHWVIFFSKYIIVSY